MLQLHTKFMEIHPKDKNSKENLLQWMDTSSRLILYYRSISFLVHITFPTDLNTVFQYRVAYRQNHRESFQYLLFKFTLCFHSSSEPSFPHILGVKV